jgi:hypothetical protein
MHCDFEPLYFARAIAGNKSEARIAMIATTTSNSISVNPLGAAAMPLFGLLVGIWNSGLHWCARRGAQSTAFETSAATMQRQFPIFLFHE